MPALSTETQKVFEKIKANQKLVGLLAPSFPIDFEYPEIVGMLKRAGFGRIVEVSKGAAETNQQLLNYIQKNPTKRMITSPCP
ncbi:hypothetical protein MUP65_00955, partial [Patescibacteria group bacterium]|nr:hypothetical protein [Patescibacteria group bacterium]